MNEHIASGQVFFPANIWPEACSGLRPALLDAFEALESFSAQILMRLGSEQGHLIDRCRLLAAAVGVRPEPFEDLMFRNGRVRHTSMLQVGSHNSSLCLWRCATIHPCFPVPSDLQTCHSASFFFYEGTSGLGDRGPSISYALKHIKTLGLLLCCQGRSPVTGIHLERLRCPGSDSGKLSCGRSGALEVKLPTGAWMNVPARLEELTVMPGTLMEYLTEGRCKGVMHRVSNPPPKTASASRRLSLTFVTRLLRSLFVLRILKIFWMS